ncbi:MAG: hypothetical protein LUF30_03230, partial [Lachnospiraceae bacterium]|nr:hypothetical protein [Lachnospiraceae bacterium]
MESASLGSELAEYVEAYSGRETEDGDTFIIEGTEQSVGNDGTAEFTDLDLGLYLVVQTVPSTGYYVIDPFVVTIPYDFSGTWVYDVDASPKTEINPQPETETETEPQTETETEPQTETETDPQTEPEPEPQTPHQTQPQRP